MTDYVIITEGSSDILAQTAQENDILVMPMGFVMEGKHYDHYPDCREMEITEFYDRLRQGSLVTTTAENTNDYMTWLTPILESGKDALLVVFSSGLSSTFSAANIAIAELKEQFPERTVLAVDSLAASAGEALFAWYAAQNRKNGMSLQENAAWLEAHKLNLAHWFTVDDLMFLKRGGRLSAATALVGTMLAIKPVLHVDNEGHLINVAKARGRKAALIALVNKMEKTGVDLDQQTVFISHGDCPADAEFVAQEVKRRFHPVDIVIAPIGPVIGAHAGPGTVALFFMGTER